MKRIILYIAVSLDGYIAEADGGIDFLLDYWITDRRNCGYKEFLSLVDAVLILIISILSKGKAVAWNL